MDEIALERKKNRIPEKAWKELAGLSGELRLRILRLIEGNEEFFVLIGSDPRETGACCPNTIVESANRLVELGLLARHFSPGSENSCPATVYALAGEIDDTSGYPQFHPNEELRKKAAFVLSGNSTAKTRDYRLSLQCLFLVLIAASIFLAVRRVLSDLSSPERSFEEAISRALNAEPDDSRIFVCFFHGREHCKVCDTMKLCCNRTIDSGFATEKEKGSVVFREIQYDAPGNQVISKKLALGMSTIGLFRYEGGKLRGIKMLTEQAWSLSMDEKRLQQMLQDEISTMLQPDGRAQ